DLQTDLAQVKPETCRRASGTTLCGYAARTSAIAQNPFRGNNYPGQCHTTPTGVKTQWRATRCRSSLGKSLHGKDLRPDRQHADEQRERRQRGGFFDHGPNHDPFLPAGQNENDVLFLFRSQERVVESRTGSGVSLKCGKLGPQSTIRAKLTQMCGKKATT